MSHSVHVALWGELLLHMLRNDVDTNFVKYRLRKAHIDQVVNGILEEVIIYTLGRNNLEAEFPFGGRASAGLVLYAGVAPGTLAYDTR